MTTAVLLPPDLERPDGTHVRRAMVEVENIVDDKDAGFIEAKLVPYEHEVELTPGVHEVFSRGAFAGAVSATHRKVHVMDQGHQQDAVGFATELREELDGLYGTLRIDKTRKGKDLLMLLRSGTLSDLSIEFRPQTKFWKRTAHPDGGELWRHNRATLVGVSPVAVGAYGDEAQVLSVREAAKAASAQERTIARLRSLTSGPRRA